MNIKSKFEKYKYEIYSISITLLVSLLLAIISIYLLGDYGWTVFIFIPFLIGFLPTFMVSSKKKISVKYSQNLGLLTLGLAYILSMIFGMEGLICIVMSVPIFLVFTIFGSFISRKFQSNNKFTPTNTTIVFVAFSALFLSFDKYNSAYKLIPVTTQILITSDIETVWDNVVSFDTIDNNSRDWIFNTGIACPMNATIKGDSIGAIRYCNFSTGCFVEPITKWQEPTVLSFIVTRQPIPMNELNPFWDIKPPHLEGYFSSKKGQFKLTKISENKVLLKGTTWYKITISPEFYWKLWSDFIIHKIHYRVLNHIKNRSEETV